MPRRSRAALKSSAARSVWAATCLSVSTPSTRWMPPCRSSPRLMVFLGGYSAHADASRTTRTMAARARRFLGILVALALPHPPDGAALEVPPDPVRHAQSPRRVREIRDRPIEPARRHHAIAALERAQHALALALLPLLRTDHEEVKDREHGG